MPEPETQNRKLGFFSKQWNRRPLLIGLGIHFSFWWVFSVWLDGASGGWTSTAWHVLIAPAKNGVIVMGERDVPWEDFAFASISLLATVFLLGGTIVSAVKPKRWIALLTHLCVPIYWFLAFLATLD